MVSSSKHVESMLSADAVAAAHLHYYHQYFDVEIKFNSGCISDLKIKSTCFIEHPERKAIEREWNWEDITMTE